ncbi:hypothetical protein [Enterobacter hormaechei]|uniref:hypothetical protein n=1 Tax=Enterobacter hormaechei TaxID=158836 RepID=UPI003CE809CC
MTFTQERITNLLEFNSEGSDCQANAEQWEVHKLARIALASLEAEAVAECQHQWKFGGANKIQSQKQCVKCGRVELAAPPAPVSVPDGYRLQPISEYDAMCAAMLQGAEQQNRQQNIPDNIPATQFKPVADLYGLTSPTGGETSFTFDAVEARDFFHGGWSVQEYVELERYQQACVGNSPVIPDGWVLVPVEPTAAMISSGIAAHFERSQTQIHDRPAPGPMECAYVAMLAAAPQQEVTQALAKGMERYVDAMQELAKKEVK